MACGACEKVRKVLPRAVAEKLRALEARHATKPAQNATNPPIHETNPGFYATERRPRETP